MRYLQKRARLIYEDALHAPASSVRDLAGVKDSLHVHTDPEKAEERMQVATIVLRKGASVGRTEEAKNWRQAPHAIGSQSVVGHSVMEWPTVRYLDCVGHIEA